MYRWGIGQLSDDPAAILRLNTQGSYPNDFVVFSRKHMEANSGVLLIGTVLLASVTTFKPLPEESNSIGSISSVS